MHKNVMILKPYSREEKICTCGNDPNITTHVECSSEKVKQCDHSNIHEIHMDSGTCSTWKDNIHNVLDNGDVHTTIETSFIPTANHHGIYPQVR